MKEKKFKFVYDNGMDVINIVEMLNGALAELNVKVKISFDDEQHDGFEMATLTAEESKDELKDLVKQLFEMLDYTEESDSGTIFHPTHFSSCRIMHVEKFDKIMAGMKKIIKE